MKRTIICFIILIVTGFSLYSEEEVTLKVMNRQYLSAEEMALLEQQAGEDHAQLAVGNSNAAGAILLGTALIIALVLLIDTVDEADDLD
jgi:hypothetical protein